MRHSLALLLCLALPTLLAACGDSHTAATAVADTPAAPPATPPVAPKRFELVEATVADIHAGFAGQQTQADGSPLSCVALYQLYVDRIAAINDFPQAGGPPVRGVSAINPKALEEAQALDALYAAEGIGKRPLHCVPMLLKDNYDTFDHPSTSGSYSMLGHQAGVDANAVAGLRRAGALILGKAHQDEFAFTVMGTSGRGVQTSNPYDTSQNPGGSSSGSGASIASNFAAIGTGTDTCMSIRYPSSVNGLVGVRPSVGLVSQHGVFPLTHARDAPGPMARTVRDVALALSAMAGADPRDPKTLEYRNAAYPQRPGDYTLFLDRTRFGLKGRKLGFVTQFGSVNSAGSGEHLALLRTAMDAMRALGAEVYDVQLPDFVSASAGAMHFEWNQYFRDFERENGSRAPRRCMTSSNAGSNSCLATDGIFETLLVGPVANALVGAAVPSDPEAGPNPAILKQHADTRDYVQAFMDDYQTGDGRPVRLDALLIRPGSSPRTCDFGSTTQMPSVVVPTGFTADGVPKGIEILARRWDEPTALGLAYDYEQATHHRRPPVLAANPAAQTLVVAEFNRFQQQVLAAALNENPQALPVAEYAALVAEYVTGFIGDPPAP